MPVLHDQTIEIPQSPATAPAQHPHRTHSPRLCPVLVVVEALRRRQGVGLQVALDAPRQRQRVNRIDRGRLPDNRPTAQLLQRQHLIRPPDPLHSVPVQRHSRQLAKGLADVKVAQRGDLEAGHLVPHRIHLGRLCRHLSLELEVQPVADQHFGHPRRMLLHLLQPPVDPVKAPLVRYIVHEDHALGTARIRSDDGAEAALARCVPQLQADSLAVQQDRGGLVSCWNEGRKSGCEN